MRALRGPVWLLLLTGCFYATRGQFDEAWDRDGDSWPLEEDCAPANPDVYPGAPDVRGDGCDADCSVESDRDGDDWPDDADCAPDDPTIFPCADDPPGDGIDQDCDNTPGPRSDTCPTGEAPGAPVMTPDCEPAA